MTAFDLFKATIKRSNEMVALYDSLRNVQKDAMTSPEDVLRSALTLSIAGMDSYFTDRFSESFVPYIKKKTVTPKLIDLLNKAGMSTEVALEMLAMERPYRRVRTLIEAHLSEYTTQRQHVIDDLFLTYGVKNLCKNAQGLAHRKTLLKRVDAAVKRRHAIVHEGDYNSHYQLQNIARDNVAKYINEIELFVSKAEELLKNALTI